MRKNRFLTIAGCLMVLCLLTTCVIGTTFAKYVTGGETGDSARVAKWGVKLELSANDLFKNEYASNTTGYTGVTVKSHDDAAVVAPGTVEGVAARFAITGTPEVSTHVIISMTNVEDVVLVAGTYLKETTADPDDVFTLTDNYYPVVFTLRQVSGYDGVTLTPPVVLKSGTLADIRDYLATYSATAYYAPNTDLDAVFEIVWTWDFAGANTNDAADTYLGNRAAGLAHADGSVEGTHYVLNVGFQIDITVEQVD